MATKHELEIEITADGKIEVHVKGAKGKRCLDYVQVFAAIGRVEDQQNTSEFYEPESVVSITERTQTRTKL